MPGIAVVHLVHRRNGLEPFARFLSSYRENPAGVAHELVLLFKGFQRKDDFQAYDRLIGDLPHRRDSITEEGFDLDAYFGAARRLEYEYFCFLNSFSRILDAEWLAKLHRWVVKDGVGMAGASGSWQSINRGPATARQGVPSPGNPRNFLSRLQRALRDPRPGMLQRRLWTAMLRLSGALRQDRDFPPFPNYHLRTNAFMAARATLLRIRLAPLRTKLAAYKFESGVDSMTRQVLALGLQVLVVGRDGQAFPPERWHESNTFWRSRQQNLLVADNQTDTYLSLEPSWAAELSSHAWGEFALHS
jgi:hypothetical protein